ncbi:MAG: DUF1073 domain-containing protein [Anaerolineae bacterium]|nr:DUF1073 domain-containing protein [Anaerolineae bacterium]
MSKKNDPTSAKPLPVNPQNLAVQASALVRRALMASQLGQTFGGDRDIYKVLGYKTEPQYGDFFDPYDRQDIAGRVVDLPAQDTWRRPPVLIDGEARSDGDGAGVTPFLKAWSALVESRKVWHYFERLDRLAGIGRYGLLLVGLKGGAKLSEPLGAQGEGDIIYLKPLGEGSVHTIALEQDSANERFGLPRSYKIKFEENGTPAEVHHSRVLHVAEDLLDNEIYGRPRLLRVLNRLEDLQKIVGGGAEATWKVMRKGLVLSAKDGYQMPEEGTAELKAMLGEIEEYDHGLRRILRLAGVDAKEMGADVVDPTGLFEIIIALIAAAAKIPKRILIGSERGELASSQDEANWAGEIASRQTRFAEPVILRPFIDFCIGNKILPKPSAHRYTVEWPSIFELSDLEKAQVAEKQAIAAEKYAAIPEYIPPGESRPLLGLPAESKVATVAELLDAEDQELDGLDQEDGQDTGA